MNEDERALLQAQATIFAGLLVQNAVYFSTPEGQWEDADKLLQQAQRYAHQLAQNLDLGSGQS